MSKGFRLPKVEETTLKAEDDVALSVIEAGEFILWLEREQPDKWRNVILGVALQALAGLRVTEVLRLTCDKLRGDTVVIDTEVKNKSSIRRIQLPSLVLGLLAEYRDTSSRGLISHYRSIQAYATALSPMLRARGCLTVTPKDLRKTLPTEFRHTGNYGYAFERYIGHSARTITDKHYVALSEEGRLDLMRKQVVAPIDKMLRDLCEKRHKICTDGNVLFIGNTNKSL